MTPIGVRQLSDGEELVLVEGLASVETSMPADPRGQLSEVRNQATSSASGLSDSPSPAPPGQGRTKAE